MKKFEYDKNTCFCFLGIGGIGMSGLAEYLYLKKYKVVGFDAAFSEQTERLRKIGVEVYKSQEEKNRLEIVSRSNVVVYTDAISVEDELMAYAIRLNKVILSRAQLLSEVIKQFPASVAVAGSHGKTTCSAMCAHILKSVNVPFTAFIGGIDSELGNFYMSGDEFVITEACEYKKNVLKIQAQSAVLLNIDADHMECYKDENDLIATFQAYCNHSERAFVCADNTKCLSLGDFSTFGIEYPLADYRAANVVQSGEKYRFTIYEYGKELCRVCLQSVGFCNIYNALAAFSVMRSYGFNENEIAKGLEDFKAVKRRFEEIGRYKGSSFICDYAHHPKELRSTIKTAEYICRGKLYVVFQPHTYSRTKLLMQDFVEVLREVQAAIIYKTYSAREYYDEEGAAKTLADNVGGCLYFETSKELKLWIKRTVKEGDTVLFLGAGDIYFVAKKVLSELNK